MAAIGRPALASARAAVAMGKEGRAVGLFLAAPVCQGHRSTGWLVVRAGSRELPFCVDCGGASKLVQAGMQETP